MRLSAIYKIQSIIHPERCYIGSGIDIGVRWIRHRHELNKNRHHSPKLQNHYNKYGKDDLVFIIIEPCFPEFLIIREQYYIDTLKPYFNICKKAGSVLGIKRTEEQIMKFRKAQKGRKVSEETKEKLRQANLGKKQSIETIKKRSLKMTGMKRSPHSEETKALLRLKNTGKKNPHSLEWRQKVSKSLTGRKLSEEHRLKCANGRKGKPNSKETNKKISKSMKKYRQSLRIAV